MSIKSTSSFSVTKWAFFTLVGLAILALIAAGTFFAYNLGKADQSGVSSGNVVPSGAEISGTTVDDSAAKGYLLMTSGALNQLIINKTSTDCNFLGMTAGALNGATPLPEYRGTYEQIITNVNLIMSLCSLDPADGTASDLAQTTRSLISSIQ